METITQLLNKGKLLSTTKQQELSHGLTVKIQEVMTTYGNKNDFMRSFNPNVQHEICKDADGCYLADVPTMALMRTTYGDNVPVMWLIAQLADLSTYCGVREKMTERQMEECARLIVENYSYLKVTEILLFFHRFKSWKYGSFYGTVDPSRILEALSLFRAERSDALNRLELAERERKREEHSKGAITHEEWLRLKNNNNEEHSGESD